MPDLGQPAVLPVSRVCSSTHPAYTQLDTRLTQLGHARASFSQGLTRGKPLEGILTFAVFGPQPIPRFSHRSLTSPASSAPFPSGDFQIGWEVA